MHTSQSSSYYQLHLHLQATAQALFLCNDMTTNTRRGPHFSPAPHNMDISLHLQKVSILTVTFLTYLAAWDRSKAGRNTGGAAQCHRTAAQSVGGSYAEGPQLAVKQEAAVEQKGGKTGEERNT